MVVLTGGGKRGCYRLPGIVCGAVTVVVCAVIALMADQSGRLRLGGPPAALIASGMDPAAAAWALADLGSGRGPIVLCSPERLVSFSFLAALGPAHGERVRRGRGSLRVGGGP